MAAISQSHAAAASAARSKACHHTAAAVHAAAEDTAGAAAEEPMMEILDPVRSCNILPSAVVTRPCGPASCTSGGAASAASPWPAVPLSGAVYRTAAHTSSVAERADSTAAAMSVAPAPAASMVTSAEQSISPAQKAALLDLCPAVPILPSLLDWLRPTAQASCKVERQTTPASPSPPGPTLRAPLSMLPRLAASLQEAGARAASPAPASPVLAAAAAAAAGPAPAAVTAAAAAPKAAAETGTLDVAAPAAVSEPAAEAVSQLLLPSVVYDPAAAAAAAVMPEDIASRASGPIVAAGAAQYVEAPTMPGEQMLCSTAKLPTLAVVVSSAATSASVSDATDEVVLPTAADLPAALAVAAAGAASVSMGLSAPRATEALPRAASPSVPTSRLLKKRKKSKYFSETFDGKKRRVNRIQKTKAENRAARAAELALPLGDNAESSSASMSGDVANALTVSEDHCIGTELGIRDTLASTAHYHAFIT